MPRSAARIAVDRRIPTPFATGLAGDFARNAFKNDISQRNGEDSRELPVPATYVIDTESVIRFARIEVDYMMDRAEPEEVIAALEAMRR